jgi:hypothetical protein
MTRPERESPLRGDPKDDAELALGVLLEPIAEGARVLWVGDAGSGAERLTGVAASVESVGGPRRTRGRRSGAVRTRPWPGAGEAFDLVVAPDFELDEGRMLELARLVEVGGALVVTADAGASESYARLFSSLTRSFAKVRMLGQTRFSGFAHVDFAGLPSAGASEVAFDGTAVETTEPPLRWIAVAGSLDRTFEPYLVVQTAAPAPEVERRSEVAPIERAPESRPTESRATEGRATESRGALERELDAARARLEHSEKRLEQAQREIARNGQKLDELRHQVEHTQSSLAAQAAELKQRDAALATSQRELAKKTAAPTASPAEIRELEASYAELEERLHAQGRELTALRLELERRATLVRDLVEELKEARRAPAVVDLAAGHGAVKEASDTLPELDRLRAQLVGLQRRLADAEGERASSVFRADELAAQVERLKKAAAQASPSEAALRQAAVEAESKAQSLASELTAVRSLAQTQQADVEARIRGLTETFGSERESLSLARAQAEGRARGLAARLAELDEVRSQAEARLALALEDVRDKSALARRLQAELADRHEELAVARMRPPEPVATLPVALAATEAGDARREGELIGALHRTREALASAQDERDQMVRELARSRAGLLLAEQEAHAAREAAKLELAHDRSELELLRASEASNRSHLVELRAAHEARLFSLDALEGERSGLRFRLADAEEALGSAQARLAIEIDKARAAGEHTESLRGELEVLGRERASLLALADEARILSEKLKEGASHATLAEGDALDLAQQVAILDAERAEARKIGMLLGDVERDLELLRREREAEAQAARDARAALASFEEGERVKTAGWVQRVAAREALVARLQSALATAESGKTVHRAELRALEERLQRAEETGAALEVALTVQRSEDQRERTMLSEAAISARAAADALANSRESGLRALSETRSALSTLIEGIKAPAPGTPEAVLRDEIGALRHELDDRGLMLRSLTAQLEERDERLRSFEVGGASQAMKALEARLREAEEKELRLVRELELAAERRSAAMEREAELRRLEQLLGDRDGELMASEGHLEQSQRAQAALRDQVARLGSELESLLSRAGSEPASALLERLGEILRAIRR